MVVDSLDFILACVVVVCFVLLVLYYVLCVRPKQRFESLPGPAYTSYLMGNLSQFSDDTSAFSERLLQFSLQHGPAYRLMFPNNMLMYIITHPEDIKFACVRHNFPKGTVFTKCMNELAPGGLLSLDPHQHPGTRAVITSFLNPRFLPDVQSHLSAEVRVLLQRLDEAAVSGMTIDIDEMISACLLDVISRITLGTPLGAQSRDGKTSDIAHAILGSFHEAFCNIVLYPLRHFVPALQQRMMRSHLRKIHSFISNATTKRAARSSNDISPRALLDIFVDMPDATPADIAAHSLTFLFAGHDTTAHTLGFLIFEAACRPDVQNRIREEVDATMGDFTGKDPRVLSSEEVERLSYCAQVVEETLRLYPAAGAGSVRHVDRDVGHLPHCGFPLPKGTHLLMPPMVMHRSPVYWDDPLEFRPERFAPEAMRARRVKERSFFPFLAGPRNCIGNFVAKYELLSLMALFFGRYEVALRCKPENVRLFQAGVIRPRTKLDDGTIVGLPVSLKIRK